jgi:hypothetical protein
VLYCILLSIKNEFCDVPLLQAASAASNSQSWQNYQKFQFKLKFHFGSSAQVKASSPATRKFQNTTLRLLAAVVAHVAPSSKVDFRVRLVDFLHPGASRRLHCGPRSILEIGIAFLSFLSALAGDTRATCGKNRK